MECTFQRRTLTLREPLRTAWGDLAEREIFEVVLRAADGAKGCGEAAPLEPYDGVSGAAVAAALDAYARVLGAMPGAGHAQLLAACAAERDLPQALAAVDLALWDMAGRRAGMPVAALLAGGGPTLDSIAVNATIGATDRAGAAGAAAAAAGRGFGTLKLKVGVGDDGARLAAVRAAAGPGVRLRIDANGAWASVDEALANLRVLAPAGIELCEEPVHGIEPLRAVRAASPVPIAMDETHAPGSAAADAVCLKVSRGGISAVLAGAAAARAVGSTVYLASTYDGPLGLAAALHAAAAIAPDHACGLATLDAFAERLPGPRPDGGALRVPTAPGLLGDPPAGSVARMPRPVTLVSVLILAGAGVAVVDAQSPYALPETPVSADAFGLPRTSKCIRSPHVVVLKVNAPAGAAFDGLTATVNERLSTSVEGATTGSRHQIYVGPAGRSSEVEIAATTPGGQSASVTRRYRACAAPKPKTRRRATARRPSTPAKPKPIPVGNPVTEGGGED